MVDEEALSDRGVDYDITVVWTVLAGDDEIAVTNDRAAVNYDWRSKRELDGADFVTDRVMEGLASSFDAAFVAFRSLSVTLDDDHHMQQWATSVVPGAYDAAAGLQQVAVELFFKQWNQRSRARVFSYAERGRAALKADLAMVQLRGGETASREVVGDVRWRADGGPPDLGRSVAVTPVKLPTPLTDRP